MADQFDSLAPRDIAITLRSLGRRFGLVLAAPEAPDLAPALEVSGPDGLTLGDIVASTAQAISFVGGEFERSLDHSDPLLPAGAIDPEQRRPAAPGQAPRPGQGSGGLQAGVAQITKAGEHLADRIDSASSQSLEREIKVVGHSPTTPLAIGRELARTAVTGLRAAEAQLEHVQQA